MADTTLPPTGSRIEATTPCPCCGTRQATAVATRDGKSGEALLTVSCNACGLGRIDPLPTEEELAQWYATQYRQQYKGAVQPALRHVLRAGRNALLRWQWLREHSPVRSWQAADAQRTSLDIGSSSGEFVALMRHLGMNAMGIEPHAGYASYARDTLGLAVRHGPLQERLDDLSADSLDLVTMFHVLEHLPEPVAALRRIAQRLKPDGLLYIEVPNATRPCSPHYMFFRAHVLYFTGPSLRQTLEAAGLVVVAHSADDADNLSIVARRGAAARTPAAAQHGHALVRAQQARRWGPYLLQQMREGRALHKWRARQEEKRTAARYPDGAALLRELYTQDRA